MCRQPGEDEGRERRANLGGRKPLRNLNSAASRTPALRRHDERTQWAGSPNDEGVRLLAQNGLLSLTRNGVGEPS